MLSRPGTVGVFNRLRDAVSTFLSSATQMSPRTRQELIDTKLAILACTQRQLRQEMPRGGLPKSSLSENGAREQALLLERSIQQLEARGMDDVSLRELKDELQGTLADQTVRLFSAFRTAEMKLDSSTLGGGAIGGKMKEKRIHEAVKSILTRDYVDTDKWNDHATIPFRRQKREELLEIMRWKRWEPGKESKDKDDFCAEKSETTEHLIDDMKKERMINLATSSIIKQELGYSVLTLRSTIYEAGMGLFVDGHATEGSIVGFFPGEVWPKEHLLDPSSMSHFADDDNYCLSLRYDDIIVDSRKSPHIAPSKRGSNPWAIAHTANHPQRGEQFNCQPVMFDFTKSMDLEDDLKTYIPNSYAKKPKLLGPKALDGDVQMHGLILLSTRPVMNEELFYNYRLNPEAKDSYPWWYHICDDASSKNR